MTATCKYPDVKVKITGRDGNSFTILGACAAAAQRAGVPETEIDAFFNEAMAGDYDHLLQTCMAWFNAR